MERHRGAARRALRPPRSPAAWLAELAAAVSQGYRLLAGDGKAFSLHLGTAFTVILAARCGDIHHPLRRNWRGRGTGGGGRSWGGVSRISHSGCHGRGRNYQHLADGKMARVVDLVGFDEGLERNTPILGDSPQDVTLLHHVGSGSWAGGGRRAWRGGGSWHQRAGGRPGREHSPASGWRGCQGRR